LAASEAKQPAKVVPYPVARAATALLTGGAFFAILALIGFAIAGTLTRDRLQLQHAQFMLAIGLVFTALFAGHSGAIGLLDGYSQGRFQLPEQPTPPPSAARAQNPWRTGVWSAMLVGVPLAGLTFWLLPQLWPSGVALSRFVWSFALAGGLVSGAIVWFWTGQRFLREASLAPAQRRFVGSTAAYLWQRHAWPQAIINALINGWVGAALVPGPFESPGQGVSAAAVQLDVRGTAFVLAVAIALGVRTQSRFDVRWGIAPQLEAAAPRAWFRAFLVFGSAPALALLVGALYAGLGLGSISAWTFVLWRSLVCGVYCGAIAYWVARWNLCVLPR
jgi:hypothetical protein